MSILAASAEQFPWMDYVMLGIWISAAIAAMIYVGFFRRGSIVGPLRLARGESISPVMGVFFVGAFTWFASQVAYAAWRTVQLGHPLDVNNLPGKDSAFFASVPGILGFVVLLIGDKLAGERLTAKLGMTKRWFKGVLMGLLAIAILLPLVILVMDVTEGIYRLINFKHPMEHELLKSMAQSPHLSIKLVLVFGAAIVAPFFEEYLFRAHLQTILKRAFIRLKDAFDGPPLDHALAPLPPLNFSTEVLNDVSATAVPNGFIWQSWLAVLTTSVIFSLIHPGWMRPGIFLLSVGLGYVYERTGNLWANVTMHLAFNSINTVIFLCFMQ